ncbi:MAG: DUF177 domain-containing protein [Muribaculum sp.]|nr:DUF177 domain-containing protein [Muribaculum sp.]
MGKFSAYKIQLKSMPEGIHTFDFHLGKQFFLDMESADVRDADLNVALTVNNHNGLYALHFAITGNVTLMCDRCLDELEWPIETTYDISVKYGETYSDDSDELLEIPESDNDLNVAYMIYDTVALNIPIKHVHPLGKCNRAMSSLLRRHRSPGLADPDEDLDLLDDETDDAMTDTATDPRWDALKDFNENN